MSSTNCLDVNSLRLARENNFDLLRILAVIGVISIHVADFFYRYYEKLDLSIECNNNAFLFSCFCKWCSMFAVPCFVMLSGAFLLANNKNVDFRGYYKKTMINIGLPTIIFSIFGFLFAEVFAIKDVITKANEYKKLLFPVKQALLGQPYYHLWYLFMMFWIFLITPALVHMRQKLSDKLFRYCSWLFVILSTVSFLKYEYYFVWDPSFSIKFLGFFMIGYCIRIQGLEHKNNVHGCCIALLGFLILLFYSYFKWLNGVLTVLPSWMLFVNRYIAKEHPIILNILSVSSSILIFAGFSKIETKKDLSWLVSHSFNIYLIHAFVWKLICFFVNKYALAYSIYWLMPVCIIGTFCVSLILSVCWKKFYAFLDDKYNINNVVCGWLDL